MNEAELKYKYIKREGSQGHYTYTYPGDEGKKRDGKKEPRDEETIKRKRPWIKVGAAASFSGDEGRKHTITKIQYSKRDKLPYMATLRTKKGDVINVKVSELRRFEGKSLTVCKSFYGDDSLMQFIQ